MNSRSQAGTVFDDPSYHRIKENEYLQQNLKNTLSASDVVLFAGTGAGLSDPNIGSLLTWAAKHNEGMAQRNCVLARRGENVDTKSNNLGVLWYGEKYEGLPVFLRQLASTFQFVDFGIKILETGSEIYHSASETSVQNAVIEDDTRDLQGLLARLTAERKALPTTRPIPEHPSIEKLAKSCEETATELLNRLKKLKINGNPGWRKSIRAALLSVWSKEDIQEIAKGLEIYQGELKAAVKLLAQLAFEFMTVRREQIKDSYRQTFEWIFEEPKSKIRPWSNFSTWLKSPDSRLYWVNGKAGSGKSTLMNFFCDHVKTKAFLALWCGETPLTSANFFFWNSGVPLQMTQKGLLRSLLHQILSQNSELIPIAFPNFLDYGSPPSVWKAIELENAVRNICRQDSVPLKLFLLIDGLDEYDGDPWNMANLFKDISTCPNVKVCLSSRPLPVFDKAFDSFPTLRLEYLTFEDIQFYVSDMLGKHELVNELREKEGDAKIEQLFLEIVQKARGVLLWVEIVVRSLRTGFHNGDDLSDLKARVDIFPSELESLYEHMMKNISGVYRQHASHLFQIMRASRHDLSRGDIVPESILTVERIFFASQTIHGALERQVKPLTPAEQKAQYVSVELRLKSHCAGLLEIVHQGASHDGLDVDADGNFESDQLSFFGAYSIAAYTRLKEVDLRVEYIHRTARDFLENPDIWSRIVKDSNGGSVQFDPYLRLLSGAVMRLKTAPKLSSTSVIESSELGVMYLARVIMRYALLVNKNNFISDMVRLVDEAEKTMDIHWQSWVRNQYIANHMYGFVVDHFSDHIGHEDQDQKITMDPQSSMFTLAIRSGLVEYVRAKIEEEDTVLKKFGRPLLDYIARPPNEQMEIETFMAGHAPLKMVKLLFATGSAPNEIFDGRTPWQTFLLHLNIDLFKQSRKERDQDTGAFQDMWATILELFVENGADLNTVCIISGFGLGGGYEVETDVREIIKSAFQLGGLRSITKQSIQRKVKNALKELEKHEHTGRRHTEGDPASSPYVSSTEI
ncbi:uncharacterized protein PAC_14940 [Phialocephala subalpina]|uniref:NACHT domain-containing protein n=1 Tax=Phialocephala subalpina TaxID=576137 RepID=A0A1L7XJ20_9HELO|nr:uncharacterized protein PAC_14940 [Phialocephala subalpina]